MNETMGSIIARLRKEKGLTQEQIANELGISYQAVSKWENEMSSPDISALPLLADLFGVSVDALFGREEREKETTLVVAAGPADHSEGPELPWPDDETLRVVLFVGRRLIGRDGGDRLFSRKQVTFQYEGPALNIESDFAVMVDGRVEGDVHAGGDVTCDEVGGSVTADGDVSCDEVGGPVNAGGDVSCDDVAGNIVAGGDVSCGDVTGNVSAGGDVSCGEVGGPVNAGGDLNGGKGFSFRFKV